MDNLESLMEHFPRTTAIQISTPTKVVKKLIMAFETCKDADFMRAKVLSWRIDEFGILCCKINRELEDNSYDNDIMLIDTRGLEEGIRCAICKNPIKTNSGCDGGCVVDEDLVNKICDVIKNHKIKE